MPAPRIWTSITSCFPLVEYEEQLEKADSEYPATPSKPTLWIYGPGVGNSKESFDLQCLKAQAELAFNDIKTERRDMQVGEGAPGATLPALHLPAGDLLPSSSISSYITKEKAAQESSAAKKASQDDDEEHEPSDNSIIEQNAQVQTRTYTSLVEAKLQPALLSHLFLNPRVYSNLTIPLYFPQTLSHGTAQHPSSPLLTRHAHIALTKSHRMEMQAEIARIVNAPNGPAVNTINGSTASAWAQWLGRGGKIDIEQVQTEAEDTLNMLEGKLDSENGWFFGTENPTPFDALLYAHLYLIHLLHAPHLEASSPLRRKLERLPKLLNWMKRLHKEYF